MGAKIYTKRERGPGYHEAGVIQGDVRATVTAWRDRPFRPQRIEIEIRDHARGVTLARLRFNQDHTTNRADGADDWTAALVVEYLAEHVAEFDENKYPESRRDG